MRSRSLWWTMAMALVAATVFAQGNPTGTVSGQVTDPDNLPLPGVTVTVASPALQGARTVTTSVNGDYVVPFLPVGDYTVTFEIQGFQTVKRQIRVAMTETAPLSVTLAVASVQETVNVTATTPLEFTQTAAVASTITSNLVEKLPMGRTITDAALLAPGVSVSPTTGGVAVSGALTYENTFLVNGVVVNENLRGQPLGLFIEDAIEETKVTSANVSAEFGRFNGGIVNTVTKSGGNTFSGSYRSSFTNDGWRALTPFPGDTTIDDIKPSYEGTAGGPIFRDRLWFFAAARYQNITENRTMKYTGINYVRSYPETRYEGKLTYALTNSHNVKFAYQSIDATDNNRAFPSVAAVIDLGALSSRDEPQRMLSLNYTGILSSKLFIEGQFSQRKLTYVGSGAQTTDRIEGTPLWDRTKANSRYNAPFACAVCGTDLPNKERRNNWNAFGKVSYFLSTKSTGSHNVVAGFDTFQEQRKGDNWQSGSAFRVESNSPIIIRNQVIYPVLLTGTNSRTGTTFIQYMPMGEPSKGNAIRTYSTFVNDVWRLNNRLTFNLGVRYDKNDTKDQSEKKVGDAAAFSPRLGVTWDLGGDARWVANAGFARYVAAFTTAIADAASIAGRTNTFRWVYLGPSINADANAATLLDSHAALNVLFNWFDSVGGTSYPLLLSSTIVGVTTQVDPAIKSSSSDEVTLGVSRALGGKGAIRLDYLYRVFHDFYSDRIDMTTGKAVTSSGLADITFVTNNDSKVNRNYKGLNAQISYRFSPDIQLGGNYTLSWVRGNFTGETSDSGPDRAAVESYPEYRAEAWSYPTGYMPQDQRHKVRLWASYALPLARSLGDFEIGFIQRVSSGTHFSPQGSVDSRPYVTNPGYITPPSTVPYYFGGRGSYTTDTFYSTSLSLVWSHNLPGLGARTEVFFRGIVNNVFNNSARTSLDSSIFTNNNDRTLAPFNPFTTQPVEGVNWAKGPSFGQATGVTDYQAPREFSFSVGFRF